MNRFPAPSWLALLALLAATFLAGGCAWTPWASAPVIIPGTGVGPIRFGMKIEDVFHQLGPTQSTNGSYHFRGEGVPTIEGHGYSYDGKFLHLHIFRYPDAGVQQISVADYRGLAFLPWHPAPRTDKGIGLGSSRTQVIAAYGPPSQEMPSPNGSSILLYAALGMELQTDAHAKVDYIRLNRPELGIISIDEALAREFEHPDPPDH